MEPLELKFGKTGPALWAAARKVLFLAREHDHRGICICHYAFDGAPFSVLTRMASQEHMMRCVQRKPAMVAAGLDHMDQLLKEWVVSCQCCAHASHNALKWGMIGIYPEAVQHYKDLWEIIFGLSHSSGLLHEHLMCWCH